LGHLLSSPPGLGEKWERTSAYSKETKKKRSKNKKKKKKK
jgi:hypothetical protein